MAVETSKEPCELCGQTVKIKGFTLKSTEGIKKFCCMGCLSIFQILHHSNNETTSLTDSSHHEEKQQ
jgi:hypothetical protein